MKIHEVKGTPFYLWWGGREVDGQCKWVVDCDDDDLLHEFLLDWINCIATRTKQWSVVRIGGRRTKRTFETDRQNHFAL